MQRLILTLSNQNAYMSPRGCLRRNRNKSPKNNCKKSQLLFVAWPRWAQMCAHCAWLFVKLLFIHIAFFAFNNIHKNIRRQQQRDHGERALKTLKLAHIVTFYFRMKMVLTPMKMLNLVALMTRITTPKQKVHLRMIKN